jgi:predicted outer membrane repeat protein
MKKVLSAVTRSAILLTLLVGVALPSQRAAAAGAVGDGTPASCTQTALHTALTGGGAVTFNCGAAPVSILISTPEAITQNTSIDGGGLVTLNGNLSSQIFTVSASASLSLTGITLWKGVAAQGGAISNSGTLTITNSTFKNNQASTGQGGAIYNTGALTLTGATFTGNLATTGGGAVFSSGPLTITGGLFNSNNALNGLGGGVLSTGALSVSGVEFNANFAASPIVGAVSGGGGLYVGGTGATVSSSIFYGNLGTPRGGAIYVDSGGGLTVTTSTLEGNFSNGADGGGGIYNEGTLTLSQDLLVSNSSAVGHGGGIYNFAAGISTITNTTLAYNTAGLGGSAIYNMSGTVSVVNSTISNHSGFALDNASSTLRLVNSIVAGNTTNCRGTITSLGHNLDSANTCAFSAAGDLPGTDPKLGPLSANGGPTDTVSLLPGSPAVNAGDNASCPPTDQRGIHRPQLTTCDMGAYELVLWQFLPLILK